MGSLQAVDLLCMNKEDPKIESLISILQHSRQTMPPTERQVKGTISQSKLLGNQVTIPLQNRLSRKLRSTYSPAENMSPWKQVNSSHLQCNTFKWCKKCSLYLIPKYTSSFWYQKDIPFLLCEVQHRQRNSFVRRLHAGNRFWSACHLSRQVWGGSISFWDGNCDVHTCSRTHVETRHITLVFYVPNSQCSSATIYLSKLFVQTVFEPWSVQHQVFYTHRHSVQILIYTSVFYTH